MQLSYFSVHIQITLKKTEIELRPDQKWPHKKQPEKQACLVRMQMARLFHYQLITLIASFKLNPVPSNPASETVSMVTLYAAPLIDDIYLD